MLTFFTITSFASKTCTGGYQDVCTHSIDGECVETQQYCTTYTDNTTEYSAGCDISGLTKNINQDKCSLNVKCDDKDDIIGTCQIGTGCYPGYYFNNCPSSYDYKSTGEIQSVDCKPYGQTGTLTLETYQYGAFQSGSIMTTAGGSVNCNEYYSPRAAAHCANDLAAGLRPSDCYVDECKTLSANPNCTHNNNLDTTTYGNEVTILNTGCVWIIDPVNGNVCTTDPNIIASLTMDNRLYDVQIQNYTCAAQNIATCLNKSYSVVCPDGSSSLCTKVKTCTSWSNYSYNVLEEKTWTEARTSTYNKCVKGSAECIQLSANSKCIYTGDSYAEAVKNITVINGWDANGSSQNCFLQYNGTCLEINLTSSWQECTSSFNANITGTIKAVFPKPVIYVSNIKRIGSLSNLSGCYGAGDDAYDQYVSADVHYTETYSDYTCYGDYTKPDEPNCTQSGNELCLNYIFDTAQPTKYMCTQAVFTYECIEPKTTTQCDNFETSVVCNNNNYSLPNISIENDNVIEDFGNSMALLGVLKDINSIWSGKYSYCSYGYFSTGLYCNNCAGSGTLCFSQKPDEKRTYEMNKKKLCHYLKTDCTSSTIANICLVDTRKYCCYDSKLARVIVEQAYIQLGKSWDSGCNGISIDDLNNLDFSKMDLSEIADDLENQVNTKSNINSAIQTSVKSFYNDFTHAAVSNGTSVDGANQ